jgi:hypothetical protein
MAIDALLSDPYFVGYAVHGPASAFSFLFLNTARQIWIHEVVQGLRADNPEDHEIAKRASFRSKILTILGSTAIGGLVNAIATPLILGKHVPLATLASSIAGTSLLLLAMWALVIFVMTPNRDPSPQSKAPVDDTECIDLSNLDFSKAIVLTLKDPKGYIAK